MDAVVLVVEPIGLAGPQETELIADTRLALACYTGDKQDRHGGKAGLCRISPTHRHNFDAIVPISAKKGDGLDALMSEMEKFAEPGPHLFPEDMYTDQPEKAAVRGAFT